MVYLTEKLEQKLPWLEHPVKRMIYQVLVLFIFFVLVIFAGLSVWIILSEDLEFCTRCGLK